MSLNKNRAASGDVTAADAGDASVKSSARKRILLRISAAVLIILALLSATAGALGLYTDGFFDKKEEPEESEEPENMHWGGIFYEPDWEYDIMLDEEYVALDRYMTYTEINGVLHTKITDGNYSQFGEGVVFWKEYFDTVTGGDAEAYSKLFADVFFKEHEKIDVDFGFPMQRLYDINVELMRESEESGVTTSVYEIKYCIMKNDGMFRNDIGSDMALPLYFTLDNKSGKLLITDVSYNMPEESPEDGEKTSAVSVAEPLILFAGGIIVALATVVAWIFGATRRRAKKRSEMKTDGASGGDAEIT